MMEPLRFRTSPTRSDRSRSARTGGNLLRAAAGVLLLVFLAACGTQNPPVVDDALTLTDITPTEGDFSTPVTITGENIAGDATVTVCGAEATDVVVRNAEGIGITGSARTGTTIEFNPPVLTTGGDCDVVVEQGEGDDAESETLSFTYNAVDTDELTLADAEPASGGEGTVVTVSGVNIAGDASVEVCGIAATDITVFDAEGAEVTGDATDGVEIEFTIPAIAAEGECDIVVTQGAGEDAETATLEGGFTFVTPAEPGEAIRINAGGDAVVTDSGTWMADTYFTDGGTYTVPEDIDILGTDEDAIYRSERDGYDPDATPVDQPFSYSIPVENGDYTLVLHWAELFIGTSAPGAEGTGVADREFNVAAEGMTLESDFDVYLEAGEASYTAIVRQYDVTVEDGTLDIEFTPGQVNSPMVNAIEVLPVTVE